MNQLQELLAGYTNMKSSNGSADNKLILPPAGIDPFGAKVKTEQFSQVPTHASNNNNCDEGDSDDEEIKDAEFLDDEDNQARVKEIEFQQKATNLLQQQQNKSKERQQLKNPEA